MWPREDLLHLGQIRVDIGFCNRLHSDLQQRTNFRTTFGNKEQDLLRMRLKKYSNLSMINWPGSSRNLLNLLAHIRKGLVVSLLLLWFCGGESSARAQSGSTNGFSYTNTLTEVVITSYTGAGGQIEIPNVIQGLPVTRIGARAFYGQTNLTHVTVPNNVTRIEEFAFYGCSQLTEASLPNSLTSIDSGAFAHCYNLSGVSFPDNLKNIGQSAFGYCDLKHIAIGNNVTNIGDYAFWSCKNVTNLTLGTQLANIGADAFFECKSLTCLSIPSSVTNIGNSSFEVCSGLGRVEIGNGNGKTHIESCAFTGCNYLTNIYLGKSVASLSVAALVSCQALACIEVDPANQYFSSMDGILFDKSQTKLVQYPNGKNEVDYLVPSTVTNIGEAAFAECRRLNSITIPATVSVIESQAFSACSLSAVYFRGSAPMKAPIYDPCIFGYWSHAIVYYLAGTTGWQATYSSRPTKEYAYHAPELSTVTNVVINPGQTANFTATATDADAPAEWLTFSLASAPAGASINPSTGLFAWRPDLSLAGTTQWVEVQVSDSSVPPLTDRKSFPIIINPLSAISLSPKQLANSQFVVEVQGTPGLEYIIQNATSLPNWTPIATNTPTSMPWQFTDTNQTTGARFYRALAR